MSLESTTHPRPGIRPDLPFVSVAIPALNEAANIRGVVETFLSGTYAGNLEILVADGGSGDGTWEILSGMAAENQSIRIFKNRGRFQSFALNLMIEEARGGIFIRADAHCQYANDYVERCVETLLATKALNVGGAQRFIAVREFQLAVAFLSRYWLGSGLAWYREPDYDGPAETVFLGCYWLADLREIGGYDTTFVVNEDSELNRRLSRAFQGKALSRPGACDAGLAPVRISSRIRVWYYPRATLKALCRQYFLYGTGRLRFIVTASPGEVPARSVIPAIALASAVAALIAGVATGHAVDALLLLAASGAAFLLACLVGFVQGIGFGPAYFWRGSSRPNLLLTFLWMPAASAAMLICHPLGMLVALFRRGFARANPEATTPSLSAPVPSSPVLDHANAEAAPCMVSVVIPMRNEERAIEGCLESIFGGCWPRENLEVLVVDGNSTDRSLEIVTRLSKKYPQLKVLHNPRRTIPSSLNLAIREASGSTIVRMDAHATYASDYITQCVRLLDSTGAQNVGGAQKAVGTGYVTHTIAFATSAPFGAGDAYYKFSKKAQFVDTVFLGAWRKSTLERLGGFNEEWVVNQDYELNLRLRRSGGRIYLSPDIRSEYHVRPFLSGLARQYFRYGFWKVKTLVAYPESVRWRQLIPPMFTLGFVLSLVASVVLGPYWGAVAGLYCMVNLIASTKLCARLGWRYLALLPFVFLLIHLCWGAGFWLGLTRFGVPRFRLADLLRSTRRITV